MPPASRDAGVGVPGVPRRLERSRDAGMRKGVPKRPGCRARDAGECHVCRPVPRRSVGVLRRNGASQDGGWRLVTP
eukprot:4925070-Prymnesium_polylepis.1